MTENNASNEQQNYDNQIQEENNESNIQPPNNASPQDISHEMFEQRFQLFMGQLADAAEKEKCPVVIAYVLDPVLGEPLVMQRGHIYDKTLAAKEIHTRLKAILDEKVG